ncbi:hypothetical protein BHU72_03425 [Desulfuribacillus stibiiarsenatis]|uniref:Flagellar Assembly Protein A N-terminal region domain-containing protein n=1 Tax=Desulfuribacillus stibiiarsenatis TaxID=1390249 RepID=A0A1E5L752_9FIRM|nr:hypothetical protein BHU72_03425 [Desulfuribacillus stibiiarsenatis]
MEEKVDKKPFDWNQGIQIKVTKDKLEAVMVIDAKCDEDTVEPDILKNALNKAKISYGIIEELLLDISKNVLTFRGSSLTIAKGVPSENGIDGYIELLRDDLDKKSAPLLLKDGRVDFYHVKDIPTVLRGEEIARKIPPVPGKSGTDVYGHEIKPKVGKDPRFPVGKNVVVNQEGTSIYALIDGQVSITERGKINVFSVYEVHGDVDFSTGNIDFVGSVLVNGNILTGFSVKAKGDIRVKGNIEGANVEAEGSIEILGGIIGYNKGNVRSKQNLKASFIQNANVTVDNTIIVTDSIMHSHVNAGKMVSLEGQKALIVGGLIRAGEEVIARVIGNSMATPTEIEVGVHPELRSELVEIREKLKDIAANYDKSDQALVMLNRLKDAGRITPDKEVIREKLESSLNSMKEFKQHASIRMQEIEQILQDSSNARVKVGANIYPGVKLVIGNEIKYIRDLTSRVIFYKSDGEITFMPMR